jgi:hypothetical protein
LGRKFNGKYLNEKWNIELEMAALIVVSNNERQLFTLMKITRCKWKPSNYSKSKRKTSTTTTKLKEFQYGYFEARAVIKAWHLACFWMLVYH